MVKVMTTAGLTYCQECDGGRHMAYPRHFLTSAWQAHYGAEPVLFYSEAEARREMARWYGGGAFLYVQSA